ncbi:MAG TPA: hypothetical protein VF677_10070 [Flavobacterium sp.]|jgi:hypothetical protein
MSKKLHLVPKMPLPKGQKFDKAMGCLTLSGAGNFTVEIIPTGGLYSGAPKKLPPFKKLTQEEVWAMPDIDNRKRYVLDLKKREAAEAKYAKEKEAFNATLKQEFDTLGWSWELVGNGMKGRVIGHNSDFKIGMPKDKQEDIPFPEILVGGGFAWLEVFTKNDPATGKVGDGLFVRATGVPQIVRVAWTDADGEPITKRVTFGSTVLLNIYTAHLYGQDVEVGLWDKDTADPDDLLPISNKDNFNAEVLVYKLLPYEVGKVGVSGGIKIKGESESHVQKIRIPVLVDPNWKGVAGKELKIYPTVKSKETGEFLEVPTACFLEVATDAESEIHLTVTEPTNNPVLVGKVETNIASFKPCQYTGINMEYEKDNKKETIEVFKENLSVSQNNNLEIGIIVGSDPKDFNLKVDDKADTKECRFHGKPSDHAKNIFSYDQKIKSDAWNIMNHYPTSIDGKVKFDYDRLNMIKYFWLSNDFKDVQRYPHFKIYASSCRYFKTLNLTALPDIEWELAFIITTMAGFKIKAENTTVTRLNQGLGQYQFRGIKAEQSGKLIEKGGVGYSLNIKYTINGGDFYNQISLDFVRNIEKIIDTYNSIAGFAAIFKGDEDNVSSAAISKSVINKITFDIDPPAIVFLLKWKYDYAKKNGQAVVNFTGAAGFKPLIGLKIGVDLVANADKFGGLVGAIIKWGAKFVKKLTKLDLYIIVETGVSLNYDIGLSYNEIDGFAPNTKQKAVVDLTFTIKAGIKKKEVIFIANVSQMEGNTIPTNEAEQETFKVEGAATTGIRYTEEHGVEKGKGSYKKVDVKWLGAEITITVVTITHKRRMNSPPNEQFKDKFIVLSPKTIYGPETIYTQEK